MWPRVNGMRALALGAPGELRARLNRLVLSGAKSATACLLTEYTDEGEELEHVGERLSLVDDDDAQVGVVEVTDVRVVPLREVTWEFAAAEGEGDASLEEWRAGHVAYWSRLGQQVTDATEIVCLRFRVS